MKISLIGAGNIGGLAAMRLAEAGFDNILLVDIAKGLAQGKALDLEDAGAIIKHNYRIRGTEDIAAVKDSDVTVITAGLTRKPGMSREDLLAKNSQILKEICLQIKKVSSNSIVIIVTNPLDLMTYLALKVLGSKAQKVFGMGSILDAARFTNLISQELKVASSDIEACVIGTHGEGMLPLPRLTTIKGVSLDKMLDKEKIEALVKKTLERGHEIISLSGSAYFAPSQAITAIIRAIAKDEKRIFGVSAYLDGEYGIRDLCIGVPCRLGKGGIEQIIEPDLNQEEKSAFLRSAESIRKNLEPIKTLSHGL